MPKHHVVDAEPAMFEFTVPEATATMTRGKPPKPPWYKRVKNVADWMRLAEWVVSRAMEVCDVVKDFLRLSNNRERKPLNAASS